MMERTKATEGCARLWVSVMQRAVEDLEYQGAAGRGEIDPEHCASELRAIAREDPTEFFEGPWFQALCDILGLDPGVVWSCYDLDRLGVRRRDRRAVPRSCRAA